METRRKYTKEFKEEAVNLAEKNGNKSEVARDLGIHISLLGRWKRELLESGKTTFPGNGKPRDEPGRRAEIIQRFAARLKKENNRLKEEPGRRAVEILKKVVGGSRAVSSVSVHAKIPIHSRIQWTFFYCRHVQSVAGIQEWLLHVAKETGEQS
jgi:transposase